MRKPLTLTLTAAAAAVLVAGGAALAATGAGGSGDGTARLSGASDRVETLIDDQGSTDEPAGDPTHEATGEPTGEATGEPTDEPTASPTSTAPAGPGTRISRQVAERIAVGRAGGRVEETELEWEHGRQMWKVELVSGGTEVEVEVDASTGAVVTVERDGDHDGSDHDGGDDGHDGSHDD